MENIIEQENLVNQDVTFPVAYACYNKDLQTRLDSTSGGAFTTLATYFLKEKDAVIFGAAFDRNCNVKHIRVDTLDDLGRLRGSKYPQSNVCNSFLEAKAALDSGRAVFYTGTPCEIAGLKNFLGRKYENLFTMDFVCHGVGSDLVWRGYNGQFKNKGEIKKITFKAKTHGWKKWYFKVDYQNGNVWQRRGSMTIFMRSYLSYANIRPSCFECHFKGLQRTSDFTISDCWGVAESNQNINDNKGLSALLLQNDRALLIFDVIKDNLEYLGYDAEELMAGNWTAVKSVKANPIRERFFTDAFEIGTIESLKKHFKPSAKNWIRYYYNRLKGKEK